jgi:hypothetical protein
MAGKLRATWQLKHVEQQSPLSEEENRECKNQNEQKNFYTFSNRRPTFIKSERGNTHKSFLD